MKDKKKLCAILNLAELNIAIFAFLLNFAWEVLQGGLYLGFNDLAYEKGVNYCTRATFVDITIVLASFWLVAWVRGGRNWLLHPGIGELIGFTLIGLVTTIILEILSTKIWGRWSYSRSMPIVPILDVGIAPILQWILLPPLTVWFVRRQLL